MNVGDTVIAVPIEGDPKNVVVLPAEHVIAVDDSALMIPTDENKNSMVSVGYSLTDVGDKGILIPIGGDSGNVVFYSGRFCTGSAWEYSDVVSGEYLSKTMTLPSWWKTGTYPELYAHFNAESNSSNLIAYVNEQLIQNIGLPFGTSGWSVWQFSLGTLSAGDVIRIYLSKTGSLGRMIMGGPAISSGCPHPAYAWYEA